MNSSSNRSLQTVTLTLIVVGILALALGGYLAPISRVTITPLVSLQSWLSTRYYTIRDFLTAPRDVASLNQRNQELESEVARLQSQVIELQEQINDMQILTALLDFARTKPEYRYHAGTVIGRDPSPFLHYVFIDQGSDVGIRRGMPVVTSQGLVGRIEAVTADAARVQLITDPASIVNVSTQPSSAEAIMSGGITGDMIIEQIPQDADVQPGDLVLTSGLGGGYPPNLLVGQISGVRSRTTDIFQQASLQPVVDFRRLDIVLIITSFRPVDIAPLIPERQP